MGQDGVNLDKIVLTKDSSYEPTGQGPRESVQDGNGVFQQNTSSHEFGFSLEDDSTAVTGAALSFNTPYEGVVTPFSGDHTYAFTVGSATDLYFESLTPEANFEWTLTGPTGDVVKGRDFDLEDYLLTAAAGSYTLTISASGTSSSHYGFRLLDLTSPTSLTTGSSTTATLNPVDGSLVYSLAVTSGNRYYFDAASWNGDSNARWRLVDSSGNVLFNNSLSSDQDLVTASSTDTY